MQDTTREYQTSNPPEPASLNGYIFTNLGGADENREPDAMMTEVATALLARDYKGMGNYASNGVIETWKLN